MAAVFFENLSDALAGLLPRQFGSFSLRRTGSNLKVWYGDDTRQHYEVQLLGDGRLELGFHTEYPAVERNDAVLSRLQAAERSWRRTLGKGPEVGPFLGRQAPVWRRVSEVWSDLGELDAEAAMEVADRLAAYVNALEPRLLRGRG
jgi:hypothetical protein